MKEINDTETSGAELQDFSGFRNSQRGCLGKFIFLSAEKADKLKMTGYNMADKASSRPCCGITARTLQQ